MPRAGARTVAMAGRSAARISLSGFAESSFGQKRSRQHGADDAVAANRAEAGVWISDVIPLVNSMPRPSPSPEASDLAPVEEPARSASRRALSAVGGDHIRTPAAVASW